eukprot:gene30360-36684_t
MTYDKNCWLECMKLEPNSTDPVDCKIRPDEGLGSVGELSPGLYRPSGTSIFTSLIHTLAKDLGYDSNSLLAAPYDWRLSPKELEERDSYFTALKYKIEMAVLRHRRPVILITHSMGYHIFTYFLSWLKVANQPAMGYDVWVYRHVYTVVAIAAPLLGTPSALKAVMSGHTFSLPLLPLQARELMLTFSVTHYLNPRSGSNHSTVGGGEWEGFPPLVTLRSQDATRPDITSDMSVIESGDFFRMVGKIYQDPLLENKQEVHKAKYITDPLAPLSPQPRPPVRHVVTAYGVDLPTELAYVFAIPPQGNDEDKVNISGNNAGEGTAGKWVKNSRGGFDPPLLETWVEIGDIPPGGGRPHHHPPSPPSSPEASFFQQAFTLLGMQAASASHSAIDASKGDSSSDDTADGSSTALKSATTNHDATEGNREEGSVLIYTHESLPYCQAPALSTNSTDLDDVVDSEARDTSLGKRGRRVAVSPIAKEEDISDDSIAEEMRDDFREQFSRESSFTSSAPNFTASLFVLEHLGGKRGEKRFDSHSPLAHSGDGTVPYLSLSYAKNYLMDYDAVQSFLKHPSSASAADRSDESSFSTQKGVLPESEVKQTHTYVPPIIQPAQHLLDSPKTLSPRIEIFSSSFRGATTEVVEVGGGEHLEITKLPALHVLVIDMLLERMAVDLCLGQQEGECKLYYDQP